MEDRAGGSEASRILRDLEAGHPVELAALFPLVYDDLRRIAARHLGAERGDHTLQPTALVHEAYLRLLGNQPFSWRSKAQFYGAAAEAMRRILIDHARGKGRQRRGGGRVRLPLDAAELARSDSIDEILSVDDALCRLEEQDPRMAAIVKLRFFAGLSAEETAVALGVTDRTVYREWLLARAWLQQRLDEAGHG